MKKYQIIGELKEAGHGISIFHEDPDSNEGNMISYSSQEGWRRAGILYLQCLGLTPSQAKAYIDSMGSEFQHSDVGFYRNCGKEMTESELFHEDVCWFLEGFSQEQIEQIYNGQINFQNILSQSRPYAMG